RIERTRVVVESGKRRSGRHCERRARTRHLAEIERPALRENLTPTLRDERNLQSAYASAGTLLDRAVVGDAGTAAGDVETAVALEIDRAAIGERGAVVKVAVVIARVIQRAGVADRSRVVIDVVIDRDRGRAGNGEQAAAAYRAARPRLCRSAERDR